MITFRRALAVAAILLSCFLLLKATHEGVAVHGQRLEARDATLISPKPTGSYLDNRKLLARNVPANPPPAAVTTTTTEAAPAATSSLPVWNGDDGGRVALAREPLPQMAMSDTTLKPLRHQLTYAFPYDAHGKFPAYIWQTWKEHPSSDRFDDAFRPPVDSWTLQHPTFVHEVITDAIAANLIRHLYAGIPEVQEAYEALPKPVLKADFFRYLILLARGGIYSDIDTIALKSAVEWVPAEVPRSSYGLVVGIEADPDRPDWHDWYSRRIQFCQWTIQAKPGHPVLVDLVATITEETLRRKNAGLLQGAKNSDGVVEFTGPAIWTDSIFSYFNNPDYFDMSTSTGNITWEKFTGMTKAKKVGDVIILPITSFSPGVGQMGAEDISHPMAFVYHLFEGTWKPENERHIGG